MKNITIGLFGFGVVGEGIYRVLEKKPGLGATISKVVIKHPDKKRNAPAHLFSAHAYDILLNPDIDLVVELIDDADAAFNIVTRAFEKGKSVISANKKMIATHLETLIALARQNNVSFLYEAAACGSIPIIRNLEEYFDNDLITSVTGIINGSTNFILTQMSKKNMSYDEALLLAQEKGFAESDPSLDVEGWDARNKLKILALHAFGVLVPDHAIAVKGISSVTTDDLSYAREKNLVIKLVASCTTSPEGQITELSVLPTFLPRFHPLRLTDNEFNGVVIGGELSDEQFFYGKGAGRYPTSSAVLSDISAYGYQYRYAYKKGIQHATPNVHNKHKFYLSFREDIPDFDLTFLGPVLEQYKRDGFQFAVVESTLEKVKPFLENPGISVIKLV